MKRNLFFYFLMLSANFLFGQNSQTALPAEVNFLHSAEGKKWIRSVNPDGEQIPKSMEDDVFIFYSNGKLQYDELDTKTAQLNIISTKTWSYDKETNSIIWETYSSGGVTKKYKGQIVHIDADRLIISLAEGDNDPKVTVYKTL